MYPIYKVKTTIILLIITLSFIINSEIIELKGYLKCGRKHVSKNTIVELYKVSHFSEDKLIKQTSLSTSSSFTIIAQLYDEIHYYFEIISKCGIELLNSTCHKITRYPFDLLLEEELDTEKKIIDFSTIFLDVYYDGSVIKCTNKTHFPPIEDKGIIKTIENLFYN
uniref:Uncharacterized protein n=1 Tax=Strongyloides venezuelensis TaxID=75913 RepID=A0A0K0FXE3_STRVS